MPEPSRDPQLPRPAGDTAPAPPNGLEPALPGTFSAEALLRRLDELAAEVDGKPVTERPIDYASVRARRIHCLDNSREPPAKLAELQQGLLWLLGLSEEACSVAENALCWLGESTIGPLEGIVASAAERPEHRCAAARALGLVGWADTSAISTLVATLLDSCEQLRGSAARALGWADPVCPDAARVALSALISALSDPADSVRDQAALGLGVMRAEASVPALTNALLDRSGCVRGSAAWALGRIRGAWAAEGVIPRLGELLRDEVGSVRAKAAEALGIFGSVAVVAGSALVAALSDPDGPVRAQAAFAVGRVNSARPGLVMSPLVAALSDPSPDFRRLAACALGLFGSAASTTLPALRQSAEGDMDKSVRDTASWVCQEIEVTSVPAESPRTV